APGGGFGGAPGTPSGGSGGAGGMVATMGAGPGGGGGKGGSGPVPDADAATPGTRLKPKVFVGADGSRQPTQLWHDTQRNEECSFQRASDGVYRCLPTSMGASYGFFQDSGCTTPALAVASACSGSSLPAYANANGLPGCGESRVYQRGPVLSNAYGGQPGACSPYSPGYYTFYSLSEVPPSQFAAAELRVE
ncbi:MAG TPA: hypothetical protein VFS43_00665, partial [Polyangiaceae bacterium]|nr:hypothetical protein [Polyangiaceae bacterium]